MMSASTIGAIMRLSGLERCRRNAVESFHFVRNSFQYGPSREYGHTVSCVSNEQSGKLRKVSIEANEEIKCINNIRYMYNKKNYRFINNKNFIPSAQYIYHNKTASSFQNYCNRNAFSTTVNDERPTNTSDRSVLWADLAVTPEGVQGDICDTNNPEDSLLYGKRILTVQKLLESNNPCPQGVQGNECGRFKVWLNNCQSYGLVQDCNEQLHDLQTGRKTLFQIFNEQEEMIRSCVNKESILLATTGDSEQNHSSSGNTASSSSPNIPPPKESQKDKLKKAVKDYGGTVVVFHVTISLISLGSFYLLVSSGVDMIAIMKSIGISEDMLKSGIAAGASTFVIAYAVHKVFAPARIAITLTCTPFLVRYLRRVGILKMVKKT